MISISDIRKRQCNSKKMVTLASYNNWKGPHFATVLAGKGFSYTGNEYVLKCDDCKATADMNVTDVVSLSNEHERSCQIMNHLRSVKKDESQIRLSRSLQYIPCETSTIWKQDLKVYTSFLSIMAAPTSCPCASCVEHIPSIPKATVSDDVNRRKQLTEDMIVVTTKRRLEENGNRPIHPQNKTVDARKRSYEARGIEEINMDAQVDAGFFIADNGRRECYYCDGALVGNLLNYDPWREHARWFPVCPHVQEMKGLNFIHDVLQETKHIKEYYKGLNRPKCMDTDSVIDAMTAYPRCIITEAIEAFFNDYGSFPKRDELFYILESIRSWKTFSNYEYCTD